MKYEFVGKSLWFPAEKIFVIADLHIGYEEAMNRRGLMLPRFQFSEMIKDLESIFKKIGRVKEVVILGDLKHEFGVISEQEWRETRDILDFLKTKCEKIVLVKGNHDKITGFIKEKAEILDFYIVKDVIFIHGDKNFLEILDRNIKMIVMGHRHPAVSIADKHKKEKFKCFLVGKWKRKDVVIVPSFFPLIEGSDFLSGEENRLIIDEKSLGEFGVYVPVPGEKRVLDFGKLKKIGKLN